MRKYELMVIFDVEGESLDTLKAFTSETLAKNKINIAEENDLGQKELAYLIDEKKRGHYFLFVVVV